MAANFKKHLGCYIDFWKNCLDFSSKTDRRTYWTTAVICYVVAIIIAGLASGMDLLTIGYIYDVIVLLPSAAITVRRLHDIGKAWPWIFIVFVPVIGWIWLIVLLCRKSA